MPGREVEISSKVLGSDVQGQSRRAPKANVSTLNKFAKHNGLGISKPEHSMKIIFSRKGFDSSSGGKPSPIFPDGKMLSLPIPDGESNISYKDIFWEGFNVGEIVESLSQGKIRAHDGAHLDPDLNSSSIERHKNWQPIFGQAGSAQGHLHKQGISSGDLILFFGLFQDAIIENGKLKLDTISLPRHIIWGWFQIENIFAVSDIESEIDFQWAHYHPHFHSVTDNLNTIYLAKKYLDTPGLAQNSIKGAGVFPYYLNKLQLTAPDKKVSVWKLPGWMYPKDEVTALTYHSNASRWRKQEDHCLLRTVGRGQEFVLNCVYYPDAINWVNQLITK